jgi:hypothetical protein
LEDRTVPTVFNVGPGDVATLIADINTANSNGQSNIINLTQSTYDLTVINNSWYGPNGLPAISSNLTIHGNGAVIQRDSNAPNFRLFYVSGGRELAAGSLTMDNVTLQGGVAKGGDSNHGGGGLGAGGAIFNQGTLTLTDATLDNNQAIGGSSGVSTAGDGGGGMGGDAPLNGDGGGFGGSSLLGFGGNGGTGGPGGGGGGGGFLTGADGAIASATSPGDGGGLGGLSSRSVRADGGMGGQGSGNAQATASGAGGAFGFGGGNGLGSSGSGGGGGGVGGGGGAAAFQGGNGGFGGGGGASGNGVTPGLGGFGGGGGSPGNSVNPLGGSGLGGAIFNMGGDIAHPGSGQVTLVNCTLTNNTSQGGTAGGTIAGGEADGSALYNLDGNATLTNDTVAGNSDDDQFAVPGNFGGSPIENEAFGNDIATGNPVQATLLLNNCILAATSSDLFALSSGAANGAGTNTATVSGSHNLVWSNGGFFGVSRGSIGAGVITLTADPMLGPLQNNGGRTPTLLPQAGSPALGAGDPSLAPSTDQRGQPRPPNGPTDLGAVQVSVASTGGGGGGGGGGGAGNTTSPPALFQALLSLYLDGAILELNNLTYEFIHGDDFNIDNYFGTPSQLAVVQANAAAAGINYDAIRPLAAALEQFTGHNALNSLDDLHFNVPYGEPFGLFAAAAGAAAADQAVQS